MKIINFSYSKANGKHEQKEQQQKEQQKKGHQLWQNLIDHIHSKSTTVTLQEPDSTMNLVVQPPFYEKFWHQYLQIVHKAKTQQKLHHAKLAAFTSTPSPNLPTTALFNSIPVPTGKYTVKPTINQFWSISALSGVALGFIGLQVINQSSFLGEALELMALSFAFFNHPFKNRKLNIEANYLYDSKTKQAIAFKNIQQVISTPKGLSIRLNNESPLLISAKTKNYTHIKAFLEKVADTNQGFPKNHTNLAQLKDAYWPQNAVTESTCLHNTYGWQQNLKLHTFQRLFIDYHKVYYSVQSGKDLCTIEIPLDQIYSIKPLRKGFALRNAEGRDQWLTDQTPAKTLRPLIPKILDDYHLIKLFIEEVCRFNLSKTKKIR